MELDNGQEHKLWVKSKSSVVGLDSSSNTYCSVTFNYFSMTWFSHFKKWGEFIVQTTVNYLKIQWGKTYKCSKMFTIVIIIFATIPDLSFMCIIYQAKAFSTGFYPK